MSRYRDSLKYLPLTEDEDQEDGACLHCLHDFFRRTCTLPLGRCAGTMFIYLKQSISATCRVFGCCGRHESDGLNAYCVVKLSVEETTPSHVYIQPQCFDEERRMILHQDADFIQAIPVYLPKDSQGD